MFETPDEKFVKEQKAAARELRKSSWWKNKIANPTPCYYCSILVSKESATMDHIVPIARGGRSVKNNLVVACKHCNNAKKYKLVSEWKPIE